MTLSASNPLFKRGDCQTISHDQKSWGNVSVDLVRRTGLKKEETDVTSDKHLVLLNLKGDAAQGEYFLDGRRTGFVRRRAGALLFVPAECNWRGWEAGASTAAYLSIFVTKSFVKELFEHGSSSRAPSLSTDLGFEDPVIMNAARGIGAELSERNSLSALFIESYTATIFAQLMRRQRYMPSLHKGGLAPKVLNRVVDKIDAEFASDMALSQLAAISGLSIPHFCRAFRQSRGCPPYAYVLHRRIEEAKRYLRHSSLPITEIALRCGFSSSSHLSNTFRREAGMTPSQYRGSWPAAVPE